MRGNRARPPRSSASMRSIPARAGEPPCRWRPRCWTAVYPRACGGTDAVGPQPTDDAGLSPRVRGNPDRVPRHGRNAGSIPARAGEPPGLPGHRWGEPVYPARAGEPLLTYPKPWSAGVYPRACGGTSTAHRIAIAGRGLSPRVRGNLNDAGAVFRHRRSIPARAGEPTTAAWSAPPCAVYPRACGGTSFSSKPHSWPGGLSPRVRGNQGPTGGVRHGLRSIPARAGEPERRGRRLSASPVYPRACGGTQQCAELSGGLHGLSPRVRGNLVGHVSAGLKDRSIPARAGEPASAGTVESWASVYPRACGGTRRSWAPRLGQMGLSPRVRGNRARPSQAGRGGGSIPARAGEPTSWSCPPSAAPVYPRACGGTLLTVRGSELQAGLSPRVRGNHAVASVGSSLLGSIPARAGEPGSATGATATLTVYPRACGGTPKTRPAPVMPPGLSPRVRGNPSPEEQVDARDRSIPARAGEPCSASLSPASPTVYPRACGGTRLPRWRYARQWGLSPRVRGNQDAPPVVQAEDGSIPARAGEPPLGWRPRLSTGVYPRACGGTT